MVTIVYTDGTHPDFVLLCRSLDNYLNEAAGEGRQEVYNQYNSLKYIHNAFVAYVDDIPAGCASFKEYEKGVAEIKRVFVRPEFRRMGISKRLMQELEFKASENGYDTLILETGDFLTNAKTLYFSLGFEVIPNYGPYAKLSQSICMKKSIGIDR